MSPSDLAASALVSSAYRAHSAYIGPSAYHGHSAYHGPWIPDSRGRPRAGRLRRRCWGPLLQSCSVLKWTAGARRNVRADLKSPLQTARSGSRCGRALRGSRAGSSRPELATCALPPGDLHFPESLPGLKQLGARRRSVSTLNSSSTNLSSSSKSGGGLLKLVGGAAPLATVWRRSWRRRPRLGRGCAARARRRRGGRPKPHFVKSPPKGSYRRRSPPPLRPAPRAPLKPREGRSFQRRQPMKIRYHLCAPPPLLITSRADERKSPAAPFPGSDASARTSPPPERPPGGERPVSTRRRPRRRRSRSTLHLAKRRCAPKCPPTRDRWRPKPLKLPAPRWRRRRRRLPRRRLSKRKLWATRNGQQVRHAPPFPRGKRPFPKGRPINFAHRTRTPPRPHRPLERRA
mmetsp:Transcript_21210/g.71838  ORF Transcript_21210/g.71838 Transcript_21210/m.71838 type:complete len:403 (-) Transcript_21210:281-1489(-)